VKWLFNKSKEKVKDNKQNHKENDQGSSQDFVNSFVNAFNSIEAMKKNIIEKAFNKNANIEEAEKSLEYLIESLDVERCKFILDNYNVNLENIGDNGALYLTLLKFKQNNKDYKKMKDFIIRLIKEGADVNRKVRSFLSGPLIQFAIEHGDEEIIKKMIPLLNDKNMIIEDMYGVQDKLEVLLNKNHLFEASTLVKKFNNHGSSNQIEIYERKSPLTKEDKSYSGHNKFKNNIVEKLVNLGFKGNPYPDEEEYEKVLHTEGIIAASKLKPIGIDNDVLIKKLDDNAYIKLDFNKRWIEFDYQIQYNNGKNERRRTILDFEFKVAYVQLRIRDMMYESEGSYEFAFPEFELIRTHNDLIEVNYVKNICENHIEKMRDMINNVCDLAELFK
jgi:hypothetical protein